jgi:inosose dehydratase
MDNQSALWHISRHTGQVWEQRWRSWIADLYGLLAREISTNGRVRLHRTYLRCFHHRLLQVALPSYLWAGISEELVVSARFRVAAAPISWGICDVPGWGYQMPFTRVLAEMRELGISASELGPAGFLPSRPEDARAALGSAGVTPVGTYLDLVLHHDGESEWRDTLADTISYVTAVGADVIVLALLAAPHSYDGNPGLNPPQWANLLSHLDQAAEMADAAGVMLAVHPHLGTLILTPDEIARVLAESRVSLCVDTGHAFAGGNDVVELIRNAGPRLAHVHLKDADRELTQRMNSGELGFLEAVAAGIFRTLGEGDLPIPDILDVLESINYSRWVVLEQDVRLSAKPAAGKGPVRAVEQSLRLVTSSLAAS